MLGSVTGFWLAGWWREGSRANDVLIAMDRLTEAYRLTVLTGHSTRKEREREWKAKQTK